MRGVGHQRDLRALRPFIRDMRPVIVAVDGGADALLEAGLTPSMIVGDMDSAGEAALRCGAELVVHSYPDGGAPGRHRLEQLGLPFKLVPAPGTSQDVAMLIAAEKGARLIVSVGSQFNLVEFLDRNRKGMSSTFLTRLRIGEILVDAKGVSRLYRPRPGLTPLLVVIAAGLLAMVAVVWVTPALRDVVELLWLKLQMLSRRRLTRPANAHVRLPLPRAVPRRCPVRAGDRRAARRRDRRLQPRLLGQERHRPQPQLRSQPGAPPGRRSCRGDSPTRKRSPTACTRSRCTNCSPGASIGLVFLGGSSDQIDGLVRTAVAQAGGNVTTVVAVREPLDLAGIAHEAAGTHYARLASSLALVERFGDLVGRQLVSGGQLVDRELISRVRGSLLSAFDGQLTRLEGLVVVRAEPNGMSAEQSEASAAFESGLLAGVAAASVPAVGVELSSTEPSQIPWYRGKGISSVDDLDALAGQAALDYALAGDRGSFGAKSTADSLLPSVPTTGAASPEPVRARR